MSYACKTEAKTFKTVSLHKHRRRQCGQRWLDAVFVSFWSATDSRYHGDSTICALTMKGQGEEMIPVSSHPHSIGRESANKYCVLSWSAFQILSSFQCENRVHLSHKKIFFGTKRYFGTNWHDTNCQPLLSHVLGNTYRVQKRLSNNSSW